MKSLASLWRTHNPAIRHAQAGFTLVELLVVVGIIVALAAIVIPSASGFANRGETGARIEEFDSVQSAMDFMIIENGVTLMNSSPSTSKNDWASFPNGPGVVPLGGYLRASPTTYYYCWDTSGIVTAQHVSPAACP